jgi:hypothetical protein
MFSLKEDAGDERRNGAEKGDRHDQHHRDTEIHQNVTVHLSAGGTGDGMEGNICDDSDAK